jgi:hypothetical protein
MLLPEDLSPPPFTDDELDAYFAWEEQQGVDHGDGLITWVDEINPPDVHHWQITDTSSAEYAMRRYSHVAARIEDVELSAAEFKRQIDEWLRREKEPLERRANWWKGHLVRFLQDRREDPSDGRATVKLPSGDIVSRKVPARPEIVKEAEEDFIEWARESAIPVVKAKWSPVMAEVKKIVQFRQVLFPVNGDYTEWLWEFDDGDYLIAMPLSMPEAQIEPLLDGLAADSLLAQQTHTLSVRAVFEDEGDEQPRFRLVPGVVQVPEHVNFDVKPFQP